MIIGHDKQVSTLLASARGARCHHAWLLAGAQGAGKASIAHAVALRLLAEAAGPAPAGDGVSVDPMHPIAKLVHAGAHADYIWIERAVRDKSVQARAISVDQIRALGPKFALAPAHSPRRIVVIDAVDDLEKAAANALLKILEEPPAQTLFFLISHAPGRLLATIRSRCRILHFQPLSDDQVRAILRDHHPGMEPHTLEFLVRAARGVPGRALSIAELDLGAVDAAFAEIARSGDPDNGKRCVLATQFAAKSAQARYEALLRRAPVFLAETACAQKGRALARTLAAYEQVSQLAASARVHNLDPQSAVFEIGSIIAGLAN